jgi:hypothetical protein
MSAARRARRESLRRVGFRGMTGRGRGVLDQPLADVTEMGRGVPEATQLGRQRVIPSRTQRRYGLRGAAQVLRLVNAPLAIRLDGLVNQPGELFVERRIALHALGDGALRLVRDGVGLGGRRGELRAGPTRCPSGRTWPRSRPCGTGSARPVSSS